MHLSALSIRNFRAIATLDVANLPMAAVIAGPNGCGKSSVFDAIRLLKSSYGQYHDNEFSMWMNEFSVNAQRGWSDVARIFHDKTKPIEIKADIVFSDVEKAYLRDNADELCYSALSRQVHNAAPMGNPVTQLPPSAQHARDHWLSPHMDAMRQQLILELATPHVTASLHIDPGARPVASQCAAVEIAFMTYKPKHLGIIDYHSANRTYGRESLGGVNLQATDSAARYSQQALYNTQGKYQGIKAELVESFIKQLLSKHSVRSSTPADPDLRASLEELFSTFFPGKTFSGPEVNSEGGLDFLVRLQNGTTHDIDELSSGEKELLLGYLRIRKSAPLRSMLLIDEPELHLNPRLIRGLPRFYEKQLGSSLGNQLLLITHSDTLLRESLDEPTYTVYHMQSAELANGQNQLVQISAIADTERLIIDLVGDLATYSPRSKVVLLEGSNSEFDENMIRQLFPYFSESVNLVSAGNRWQVMNLHSVLEAAGEKGRLEARFFSITDRDGGTVRDGGIDSQRRLVWDVYHIENYLLSAPHILSVMKSLVLNEATIPSLDIIYSRLRECAVETVDDLVMIDMDAALNPKLIGCIRKVRVRDKLAQAYHASAQDARDAIDSLLFGELSAENCVALEVRLRDMYLAALEDGTWVSRFRGRNILQRFVGRYASILKVKYEQFRNLLIHQMRSAGHVPPGMAAIIQRIEAM